MSARVFAVLLGVCAAWGFHFTVVKASIEHVPVMFYVALRMTGVALLLLPFLRWHGRRMVRIIAAGCCFGAFNYVCLFTGVKLTTASIAALLLETYMPIATILSVVVLREHIGWRRITGLVLAFAGVIVIVAGGGDAVGATNLYLGALLLICAATLEASGAILVKTLKDIAPLQLLAWFGVVGAVTTGALTMIFETGQWQAVTGEGRYIVAGALVYSIVVASILAHGSYYWVLHRADVSLVAGITMLTTVFAVTFGVLLLEDPLTPRFIVGALITMAGVTIIAVRSGKKKTLDDGRAT